jgi:hypothetical protein
MAEEVFRTLDDYVDTGDTAGALEFLIDRFRAAGDVRQFFEAKLMKKRFELGLPLIQADSSSEIPAHLRDDYERGMIGAAREAGTLALEHEDIPRAWPYFRAIGESAPVVEAIERAQPGDSADEIINIAFVEGVHPAKGLELILHQHGMCRAITSFGMYPARNGRAECIALLVRSLHAEVVERMAGAIESQEGQRPPGNNLTELMAGRDWLFGEYDTYVDTSHLTSLLPYAVEVSEPGTLQLMHELCVYGQRLSSMFQLRGQPPFENPFVDYGEYILAVLGVDVEDRLLHFRKKAGECDPDEMGTAPAELLVNLAVRLGRFDEALQASTDYLTGDEQFELSCPSMLKLCSLAKDYRRLRELAMDRGDLLSYVAALSGNSARGPIENRPQDKILPHRAAI